MKERSDLQFFFVTKRPDRFHVSLPADWGDGYDNVHICCTCENQKMADARLPIFLELPIKHQSIIHEPMLEAIDISRYLAKYRQRIEKVVVGGESGNEARLCDYSWVLATRSQCMEYDVPFHFKQTGANFRKGNRIYKIQRKDQLTQAAKAGINYK
jgi:protein gp37